jgi:hypothetical protein
MHPGARQDENGLNGNLSNRCVRSEQPPNSSCLQQSFVKPEIPPGELFSLKQKYTPTGALCAGPTNNMDGFYQFFE